MTKRKTNKRKGGNSKEQPELTPFDMMPESIEDNPAAVFKLAYLDMQSEAAVLKLALVAQDYQRQIASLEAKRNQALHEAKSILKEAERLKKEHRDWFEETYKLSLRNYTYDDQTGILKKQPLLADTENTTVSEKETNQAVH